MVVAVVVVAVVMVAVRVVLLLDCCTGKKLSLYSTNWTNFSGNGSGGDGDGSGSSLGHFKC